VSENDNCYCAGTTKVVIRVVGMTMAILDATFSTVQYFSYTTHCMYYNRPS